MRRPSKRRRLLRLRLLAKPPTSSYTLISVVVVTKFLDPAKYIGLT